MLQNKSQQGIEIPVSNRILVLGARLAMPLAETLASMGYQVLVADPFPSSGTGVGGSPDQGSAALPGIWVFKGARLEDFTGFPGRFRVRLGGPFPGAVTEEVGALVVALDAGRDDPLKVWGLEASATVMSLSAAEARFGAGACEAGDPSGRIPGTCVFLCGIKHASHPNTLRRTLGVARALLSKGSRRVMVLADHLKVAGEGLEGLSRAAREAGVLFVKLTGSVPEIECEEGGCRVAYHDEALGDRVLVRPDLLVLEEGYRPFEATGELAEKLQIQTDGAGFFQGENVYNLPIFTQRTGILVVGSCKGPVSEAEALEEARAAALELHRLLGGGGKRIVEHRILLDRRRCALCLTCYRQCPHRAISIVDRRPYFDALACRSCGICAAECPMDAIELRRCPDSDMHAPGGDSGAPAGIVAFCCENSAHEAARLAAFRGYRLPQGFKLIRVPCAGSLDEDDILTAMASGVQGVMVMACHHESCKSVRGSHMAQRRVESMQEVLEEMGMERERLMFVTLAPGGASDFVRAVERMEGRLRDMGPGARKQETSAG